MKKLSINVVAMVPEEDSVDTLLAVAQAIGTALKGNQIMEVDELVLQWEKE